MKIQVVLGSIREGRVGERVAKWVAAEVAKREGWETELVDLKDYDLPLFTNALPPAAPGYVPQTPEVQRWNDKLAEADAYILVTPEYDHTIPGALKNALDHVGWALKRKPISLVSYSGANTGGLRSQEHLVQILNWFEATALPITVTLPRAAELFDQAGQPNQPWLNESLKRTMEQLDWWAKALKAAREQT